MPNSAYTALAFDYGLKNIGAAVGQSLMQSSSELPILKAKDGVPNWQEIEVLLKTWQPAIVVVGLPLNMDGSASEFSKRAQKFGRRIHGRFGYEVKFTDERLSTREAKSIAQEHGHSGHYASKPVDSIAAAVILDAWWQQEENL